MAGPKLDGRSYGLLIVAILLAMLASGVTAQLNSTGVSSSGDLAAATREVASATREVAAANQQIATAIEGLAEAVRSAAREEQSADVAAPAGAGEEGALELEQSTGNNKGVFE